MCEEVREARTERFVATSTSNPRILIADHVFVSQTMLNRLVLLSAVIAIILGCSATTAFITAPSPATSSRICRNNNGVPVVSTAMTATMADSGKPPETSVSPDMNIPEYDVEIPTNLPSDVGMDYVPLATMLATGQLAEADQFTRDALIVLAGSKAKGREFVYFTEVKRIPSTDLATIERLWNKFSGGKFGYSVQKVNKYIHVLVCSTMFIFSLVSIVFM